MFFFKIFFPNIKNFLKTLKFFFQKQKENFFKDKKKIFFTNNKQLFLKKNREKLKYFKKLKRKKKGDKCKYL